MKILSVEQVRAADDYTIKHEPINGTELMERAATAAFDYITENYGGYKLFLIFCGHGNNGGDGYVIARKLLDTKKNAKAINVGFGKFSPDCECNFNRLKELNPDAIYDYSENSDLDFLVENYAQNETIIIDALFGSGLSKSIGNEYAKVINWINETDAIRISIDIPSGLFVDNSSIDNELIVNAHEVITFQTPKLSFLLPENYKHANKYKIVDIGLNKGYIDNLLTDNYLLDENFVKPMLKHRRKFDHKGTFGHAAIVAGNYGTMGAAVLASKACIKSGVGLLTAIIPEIGYNIMQTSVPEAMVNSNDLQNINLNTFNAIGVGMGIGISEQSTSKLETIFYHCKANPAQQLVIDADALNIIAGDKSLFNLLPKNSILTPHPKEFQRLFGSFPNDFERLKFQKEISKQKSIYIVYKQAHTIITDTLGNAYFNNTGNPGMATGGSGDVLAGIITGLCARGYNAKESCILGVYLHGLAGDIATQKINQESLIAGDIIDNISKSFNEIYKT